MKPWEKRQQVQSADAAGHDAVTQGTQTPQAQTLAGKIQAAASTTPGALAATTAHNAAFAGIDAITTGDPQAAALSWLVTCWYQGLKFSKHVDQDHHKWFFIPLISILVAFFAFALLNHDPIIGLAKALINSGPMTAQAIMNFKTTKPIGIFESAPDETKPGFIPVPEGETP